jgi:hypothetical protein
MIPRLLLEILAAIKGLGSNKEIKEALTRIEDEQKRQAAILEEIRDAVVTDPAANIQIIEGPPEEQP